MRKDQFLGMFLLAIIGMSCKNSGLPEVVEVTVRRGADSGRLSSTGYLLELQASGWESDNPAWQPAGGIVNYGWPALALTPAKGEGIAFADAAQPADQVFPLEHGDIELAFEFIVSPGAELSVFLQGSYQIELSGEDGAGALYVGRLTGGEFPEIYEPELDAGRSPGLWQTVRLSFQAPVIDEKGAKSMPAKLSEMHLNGNLIHYQQEFYGPAPGAPVQEEKASGPLAFRAENGQVAVRNIRYRHMEPAASYVHEGEVAVLGLPQISYTYYELANSVDAVPDLSRLQAARTGKIHRFDLKAVKQRSELYAIRFTADLNIPVAGEYTFYLSSDDGSKMYLDDELLIDNDGIHATEEKQAAIQLATGMHSLQVDFFQGGGGDALILAYRAPGGAKSYLNSIPPEQAALAPQVQQMPLQTDEEPYLLRSFLFFPPGQTDAKRTHVISVGEADGPHYSVDLASGSLLMCWMGAFLNTVDMWNDRGIPQAAAPLGGVVSFSTAPQWARLVEPRSAWPDTLGEAAGFQHKRYELDAQGRPTFYYQFGSARFSDRIRPEVERSLSRRISVTEAGVDLYFLLARGNHIEALAENSYRIDGELGSYVLELGSLRKVKLYLRTENNMQSLAARIRGDKAAIDYRIFW